MGGARGGEEILFDKDVHAVVVPQEAARSYLSDHLSDSSTRFIYQIHLSDSPIRFIYQIHLSGTHQIHLRNSLVELI